MIIDASASMIVPQETYNKSKKKDEAEDIKPVGESSESNHSELDFNKEDAISSSRDGASIRGTGDIYNDKGELLRKVKVDQNITNGNLNIHIFV